jgi:hypothetical protein
MRVNQEKISAHGKRAVVFAFYEYLLVTLPVAAYVALEAFHKKDPGFFWCSPEWAIATIFLSFQGISLYRENLKKTGRQMSDAIFGIFALGSLVITIIASINAYGSLDENSTSSILFRLVLFIVTSLLFLLLVSSAKLAYFQREPKKNGA